MVVRNSEIGVRKVEPDQRKSGKIRTNELQS